MPSLRVVAFNGSPRPNGNTSLMLRRVFDVLEGEGIATHEVRIGGSKVRGCIACGQCREHKLGRCALTDDPVNDWIEAMKEADGLILASPTYFATVTTEMKAFMDRAGYSARESLYRKVGAPVVVARRGGAMQTYNTLMAFFGISNMVIATSSYWNMGYGRQVGEVLEDTEALQTMDTLGANMAWLMKKLA